MDLACRLLTQYPTSMDITDACPKVHEKCSKHNGSQSTCLKTQQEVSSETIALQWENPVSLINSLNNSSLQSHINKDDNLGPKKSN